MEKESGRDKERKECWGVLSYDLALFILCTAPIVCFDCTQFKNHLLPLFPFSLRFFICQLEHNDNSCTALTHVPTKWWSMLILFLLNYFIIHSSFLTEPIMMRESIHYLYYYYGDFNNNVGGIVSSLMLYWYWQENNNNNMYHNEGQSSTI